MPQLKTETRRMREEGLTEENSRLGGTVKPSRSVAAAAGALGSPDRS
jgi:hypothetical protein